MIVALFTVAHVLCGCLQSAAYARQVGLRAPASAHACCPDHGRSKPTRDLPAPHCAHCAPFEMSAADSIAPVTPHLAATTIAMTATATAPKAAHTASVVAVSARHVHAPPDVLRLKCSLLI